MAWSREGRLLYNMKVFVSLIMYGTDRCTLRRKTKLEIHEERFSLISQHAEYFQCSKQCSVPRPVFRKC